MVLLVGCGLFGGSVPLPPPEDKDFVTDARDAMVNVKAEYVLAKGIVAVVEQRIEAFLDIEDIPRMGRVRWSSFRAELEGCWNAPFEAIENVETRAVNAVDAAAQLRNRTALHEAQAVQDTAWNAINTIQTCPQALTERVAGLPRRASDEAIAWSQNKMALLNEIRVLLRHDLPARLQTLGTVAVEGPQAVVTQLGEAKAYTEVLARAGDDATRSSNSRQIRELEQMQTEAQDLGTQVSTDASGFGTGIADSGTKMVDGITNFGSRR
jgi:hypothetical protein